MSTEQVEVYVVTEGEYSDYRICAVFSDKAQAEQYVERLGGNGYAGVETWPLDAIPGEYLTGKLNAYHVYLGPGNECRVTPTGYVVGDRDNLSKIAGWYHFSCTVLARDEQHAGEIAGERRAVALAQVQDGE